ncbi:FitA-like ribbon-helix-helix domain-containing protein [Janthinobacterium sp. J1-1]|jgi:plasmid stability protein|uniref:FitA-like ribbon-helix-helix domain-containing protein n=1 Tax=unclassified Janthinobacterium TaxID=2610881 RepID=UPI002810A7B3|nr:DNA-binding protein [Janthinobacterium sp. J1-1]
MALTLTLTFNDADELLLAALHKRARAHGRSIEEEHRDILRSVLRPLPRRPLDDILRGMPDVGSEADFGRDQ